MGGDAANIDDRALRFNQLRQQGLGQRQRGHGVGVQLLLQNCPVQFCHRSHLAVAGVVDQQGDRPRQLLPALGFPGKTVRIIEIQGYLGELRVFQRNAGGLARGGDNPKVAFE